MRVEAFLEESRARHPGKTALVAGGERVSYAELDARASRLANALRARGLARGDRVVIFMNNSVEAVVSIFGALKAGAVFSVVNPGTKADKLAWLLDKYRATALVTERRLLTLACEAIPRAPSLALALVADARDLPAGLTAWDAALEEADAAPVRDRGIDVDLCMIVTTSGSTGVPKGVMMTHQNVVAAATSITTYLASAPEDRVLSVLPLAFDYGLYQVLMAVKVGATLVLEKSFTYPSVLLQKLKDERITGLPVVPTMVAILLQMKDLNAGEFPDLRYITSTAAALPPAHIQRLQDLFPSTRIYSMYGLTECKRCTWLPPEELRRRPGSVGVAIPGTEAWIVGDDGARVGPGVTGELVIRGAHVFKGYWENDEETAKMLKPGPHPWEKVLYTGDLFKSDADGYLYFVGRKDDIIKTAGEKVSPKEVENVVYALPGIRHAAVIGVPDPVLGQAIRAVVVAEPDSGLTERDVIAHCAAHLESFMVPGAVEFRSELPQGPTGKIRRSQLQAEAARRALGLPAADAEAITP